MAKTRRLKKGEHRYLDISGKIRITKPKNFKRWNEKRNYTKKIWDYKKEIKPKLEKQFREAIKKRKETLERKKITKEFIESTEGEEVVEIMKEEREKLKPALMYRLSVALNYAIHHKYYSFKIQAWSLSKLELENKIEDLRDKVINAVEKKLGFNKVDFWFPEEPNVSIQEIMYDEKLVGTEEEKDETLSITTGKRRMRDIIEKRRKHKPLDFRGF